LAEGPKVVRELCKAGLKAQAVFTTESLAIDEPIIPVSDAELKKISLLKTPNTVVAVFYKPTLSDFTPKGITLILDDVSDPGNLGTIIRLCDWFGIANLICSHNTVDCYN